MTTPLLDPGDLNTTTTMPTWMVKLAVYVGSALVLGFVGSFLTCLNWLFLLQARDVEHSRDISDLKIQVRLLQDAKR